jgi:hypothetical protein
MERSGMSTCDGPYDRPARREQRSRRRHLRARFGAITLGAVVAAISAESVHAEIVGAWNFNGVKPVGAIAADVGDGWVDLADVGGEADLFSGTIDNAFADWRAGEALGLRGTAEGGHLMVFTSVDPTFGDVSREVSVSFATRRSATGFAELRLDAWDGGAWTAIDTFAVETEWSVSDATFTLSNWATDVQLRLVPIGATAGSGTFRLDNLVIDVTTVPAPGALALMGVAGGCVRGRRRDRLVGVARR